MIVVTLKTARKLPFSSPRELEGEKGPVIFLPAVIKTLQTQPREMSA